MLSRFKEKRKSAYIVILMAVNTDRKMLVLINFLWLFNIEIFEIDKNVLTLASMKILPIKIYE